MDLLMPNPIKMTGYGHNCTEKALYIRFLVEEAEQVNVYVGNQIYPMQRDARDIWTLHLEGNYHNEPYSVELIRNGESEFTIDPWAVSATSNSKQGVFINHSLTNPPGWLPFYSAVQREETILYETHVRDFTVDSLFTSEEKGFFNRFADPFAKGIPHLKELGITHVHLLPIFDYTSVDDHNIEGTYNWGYDPFLFNVPEGSLSSNPSSGEVRVKELKQLIQTLHDHGISVVMDVVYNHTSHERKNPLHSFFPSIAYRKYETGEWGNGSGCGNELNTENPTIRQFIIDSLLYWQREYHIDGFRFDLMALYDTETMKEIERELKAVNPQILLYGEPWCGGVSALPLEKQFTKGKQWDTQIAMFNDEFRNAIKGDNDGYEKGFIAGSEYHQLGVLRGALGSIHYNDWLKGFAKDPIQTINYVSAHDNLCLFDKIEKSCPEFFFQDRIRLNKFALSIMLTSPGIPFIAQGTEFLHTKHGHHNSYKAGDSINSIKWEEKDKRRDFFQFTRDLIRLRKDQSCLHMGNANDVRLTTRLIENNHKFLSVLYEGRSEEDYESIIIAHNANSYYHPLHLPDGEWLLLMYDGKMDLEGMEWLSHSLQVPYYSTAILVKM